MREHGLMERSRQGEHTAFRELYDSNTERLVFWWSLLNHKTELFPPGVFVRNLHLGAILGIVLRRFVAKLGASRFRRNPAGRPSV